MRVLVSFAVIAALGIAACSETVSTDPGVSLPDDPVTNWFRANGTPLNATDPNAPDDDLVNFIGMMGSARLIGVGEQTHGTREFYEVKHRLLKSLVARKATMSAVAVEATMPEAMDIDAYVRGGAGDPAKLLSRLWFWTTRNQEMVDLIKWMRQYNSGVAAAQQIRFYGIDMQYPGGAVRRITAWIPASMAALASKVAAGYECIQAYINDDAGVFARDLDTQPQDLRDRCMAGAQSAAAEIAANAGALRAATGDEAYEMHARLAETVVQWTRRSARRELQYRDQAMAENAQWILGRGTGRVLVSAHNGHITMTSGTMGRRLRQALGTTYLAVGFAFDSGSFNAHPSTTEPVTALNSTAPADDSYESFLRRFVVPFYFDTRNATGFLQRQFLIGPKPFREIGALYYTQRPESFVYNASLMNDWDVMFWIPRITPTRLLPFTP